MPIQEFVTRESSQSYAEQHCRQNGGTIVCEEKKSKYTYRYQPNETFLKIHIDNGLIQDSSVEKCDYLLLNYATNENVHHSIFIELKGSDLLKAGRQIMSTIDQIGTELQDSVFHARIVLTNSTEPDDRQRVQRELKKKKCDFACATRSMTEHSAPDGSPTRI